MVFFNNGLIIQDSLHKSQMPYDSNKLAPIMNCYCGVHKYALPYETNEDEGFWAAYRNVEWSEPFPDGTRILYHFANNISTAKEFIDCCKSRNYILRYLFIQSTFGDEIWNGEFPKGDFLGYEICEIPFDAYTFFEVFMNDRYNEYAFKLNENGLFKTEVDALAFKREYERDLAAGIVGDGEVDLYVCKIYEVSEKELLKVLCSQPQGVDNCGQTVQKNKNR